MHSTQPNTTTDTNTFNDDDDDNDSIQYIHFMVLTATRFSILLPGRTRVA